MNADRDLFGRLLIAAKSREVNLKDVLKYELSPVPYALAHQDGTLRKTTKSALMPLLEETTTALPRLPASQEFTTMIVDGMATIQMTKFGGASTFGQLAIKYYDIFTSPLQHWNCNEVHIVFDQYWETSIKSG